MMLQLLNLNLELFNHGQHLDLFALSNPFHLLQIYHLFELSHIVNAYLFQKNGLVEYGHSI